MLPLTPMFLGTNPFAQIFITQYFHGFIYILYVFPVPGAPVKSIPFYIQGTWYRCILAATYIKVVFSSRYVVITSDELTLLQLTHNNRARLIGYYGRGISTLPFVTKTRRFTTYTKVFQPYALSPHTEPNGY